MVGVLRFNAVDDLQFNLDLRSQKADFVQPRTIYRYHCILSL